MHCLTKFFRAAGLNPYLGSAHYLYACYLKSQISPSSPPSECNVESVWSCQVDLRKDMPKACTLHSLTHPATRAPQSVPTGMHASYCCCEVHIGSVTESAQDRRGAMSYQIQQVKNGRPFLCPHLLLIGILIEHPQRLLLRRQFHHLK